MTNGQLTTLKFAEILLSLVSQFVYSVKPYLQIGQVLRPILSSKIYLPSLLVIFDVNTSADGYLTMIFSHIHSTADIHILTTPSVHHPAFVNALHTHFVECTKAYSQRVKPFPHMCPTTLPADCAYSSAGSLKSIRGRRCRCRLGPPPRATIVRREGGGA